MKRRITLITAAVVAACAVLPSVASAATTSTLTASPASVDFGTRSTTAPTGHSATVTNTGHQPGALTTAHLRPGGGRHAVHHVRDTCSGRLIAGRRDLQASGSTFDAGWARLRAICTVPSPCTGTD